MAKKIGFWLGLGAGAYLALQLRPEQAEKLRQAIAAITQSEPVQKATQAASEALREALRAQGIALTDKVALAVKTNVFGAPHPNATAPELPKIYEAQPLES